MLFCLFLYDSGTVCPEFALYLHNRRPEINQKAMLDSGKLEISNKLITVSISQFISSFKLKNQPTVNYYISLQRADKFILIKSRYIFLYFNGKPITFQFISKSTFIEYFHKSGFHDPMHSMGTIHNLTYQFLYIHSLIFLMFLCPSVLLFIDAHLPSSKKLRGLFRRRIRRGGGRRGCSGRPCPAVGSRWRRRHRPRR